MDIAKAKLPNFGAFLFSCFPTILYAFSVAIRLNLTIPGVEMEYCLVLIGFLILAMFSWYSWKNDGIHGWLPVRRWMVEKKLNRWVFGGYHFCISCCHYFCFTSHLTARLNESMNVFPAPK